MGGTHKSGFWIEITKSKPCFAENMKWSHGPYGHFGCGTLANTYNIFNCCFFLEHRKIWKLVPPKGRPPAGKTKLGVIHDYLLSYYRFVWNWYLWYSDLDTSPFVCNTALGVLLDAEISKSLVFSENKMLYSQKIRCCILRK